MRFPEFTGEWEKVTLKDIADFQKDRISSGLLDKNTYISTENIQQNFGGVQSANSIPANTNVIAYNENDILLSNIRPYLKKVWFADSNGGCSADVFVLRSKCCEQSFLYNVIASDKFIDYVMSGAKGVKMPRGDKKQMENFKFSIPTVAEQRKISKILFLLNERIATQNKIIKKYESLIKGLTNQLLIPNSNWQSTTIGQVLTINSGKDYKHLKEGNIPVYGTGGHMLSVNDYLYDGESVCIGRKGTINKPIFLTGKFWTVDTLFYTSNFNSLLPRFGYYLFKTIDWLKYNEASGVPSLSKVSIEKIQISLPSLEIQSSICSLLDSIYDKLALEESILSNHYTQKVFLLQQMFI